MKKKPPTRKQEADPTGKTAHSPGAKLDAGKPLAWLILSGFTLALAAVVAVGTFGAVKYTPNGWKTVEDPEIRYGNALMRHLLAHWRGEIFDKDSKLPHMAHAAWNVLALLSFQLRKRKPAKRRRTR